MAVESPATRLGAAAQSPLPQQYPSMGCSIKWKPA
jgi:hypothetical protein